MTKYFGFKFSAYDLFFKDCNTMEAVKYPYNYKFLKYETIWPNKRFGIGVI